MQIVDGGNLTVLQMYETTSLKGMEGKGTYLTLEMTQSIRLLVNGTGHMHCTLVNKVVSQGNMD